MKTIINTSDFEYELPLEFIAQIPIEPRDSSRLLILRRDNGQMEHHLFRDLGNFINPGDLLVLNKTRVIPARLFGRKVPTGGRVEFLLLRQENLLTWEVMVGGKGLTAGRHVQIDNGPLGEVVFDLGATRRIVRFDEPLEPLLDKIGHVPLPPYILAPLEESERYQTVYAQESGSVAAPTAGLHFTEKLMNQMKDSGVNFTSVVLHVGLDTFAPVNEEDPREHKIHTEWCQLAPGVAKLVNQTKQSGGRVIAVGTTSVRTLETAGREAGENQFVSAFEGPTDLFILPGYQFKVVDALITNFHLPRSTLVMLVSAFSSREQIFAAYEKAKQLGYRFYSFGDAMLIL